MATVQSKIKDIANTDDIRPDVWKFTHELVPQIHEKRPVNAPKKKAYLTDPAHTKKTLKFGNKILKD